MKYIRFHLTLALIVLVLFQVAGAHANTWRVERDGSGDYTDIPSAIAVASVGDTIRIGPGRFTETVYFNFTPNYATDVYIPVSVDSLTIMGSGMDETVVGPTSPNFVGEGPKGVVAPLGINHLLVQDMTIENVKHGAYFSGESNLKNMRMQGCDIGAWEFTVGARVDSCEFPDNYDGVSTGDGCANLTIATCVFSDNNLGIGINRTQNVSVESCDFVNSNGRGTAIQYSENCIGLVEDCKISWVGDGIAIRSQSDVMLVRNHMDAQYVGLYVFDGSIVRGEKNVMRGGEVSLALQTTSTAFLSGNHILKTGQWAVHCRGFTTQAVDIDLRNNYWGTDNADSISAWIFDGNDPQDPFYDTNLSNVLYEPFSPVPVEAEESSVGSLKSQFLHR